MNEKFFIEKFVDDYLLKASNELFEWLLGLSNIFLIILLAGCVVIIFTTVTLLNHNKEKFKFAPLSKICIAVSFIINSLIWIPAFLYSLTQIYESNPNLTMSAELWTTLSYIGFFASAVIFLIFAVCNVSIKKPLSLLVVPADMGMSLLAMVSIFCLCQLFGLWIVIILGAVMLIGMLLVIMLQEILS